MEKQNGKENSIDHIIVWIIESNGLQSPIDYKANV